MKNRNDFEGIYLPDDLRALDEELSSISYEERPSFAPELRAELAGAWASQPRKRPVVYRHLAAAALAGLLVIGAAVPSARASLIHLFDVLTSDAPVAADAPAPVEVPPPALPPIADEVVDEPVEFVTLPVPPPAIVLDEDAVPSEPAIPPEMRDRARFELLLQQAYPTYLQRQGVGGVVLLTMWVDAYGLVGSPKVLGGSGVSALDRAALAVAPMLFFEPATQNGTPVGTWIEFTVTFEPDATRVQQIEPVLADEDDPMRLPQVRPDDQWQFDEPLALPALPAWKEGRSSELTDAETALVEAIGDPMLRRSLGPVEGILLGIAPEGRTPTEWRTAAAAVLDAAVQRDGRNPAPLLALGRIRLRQGLRTDARMLFEQGLQIAIHNETTVSPLILAELHHERGRLIREGWLASYHVGRVRAQAFELAECSQARPAGRTASGFVSVESLIALNYLCPEKLERVFTAGFEASGDGVADLSLMMGSFRAAIDASPGHVGSNVGLLMAFMSDERWEEVLAGARRFARMSDGHPYALLLAGLALERMGLPEEAETHFSVALDRLQQEEADEIRDVTLVIDREQISEYRRLWGPERRSWEARFWATMDRTSSTEVNEREVRHLARSTYAFLRFGGTASDPGEVWVRFGGPNKVHIVDQGSGRLMEFWDYGSGADITFVRWVASKTMVLTPEGRAYVDDLGKIFPPQ